MLFQYFHKVKTPTARFAQILLAVMAVMGVSTVSSTFNPKEFAMTENVTNAQARQGQQARPTPDGGSRAGHGGVPSPPVGESDFPTPGVNRHPINVYFNEDDPLAENYHLMGEALNSCGDLYRNPDYGDGLLLGSPSPNVPPRSIRSAKELAPIIADRLNVLVFKDGKLKGHQISAAHLNTMLNSEIFLQQFPAVDKVITAPLYLPDFNLVARGYNDGGRGYRYYLAGEQPEIAMSLDTINRFLDQMDFASNTDVDQLPSMKPIRPNQTCET